MNSKPARKEAIRKFKDRRSELGAFAVRCTASRWVWVGSSRNLDATRNCLWFCLRNGCYADMSLQSESNLKTGNRNPP